jgi:hypothetical protein
VPDGGDEEEAIAVLDIQSDHADDESPALGSQVFLRSVVVTSYDSYSEPRQDDAQMGDEIVCVQDMGYTGGVTVQDAEGGWRSGIALFNPSIIPASQKIGPGDLVDVRGEYLEFCLDASNSPDSYCRASNTERLTQLGNATVTRVGEVAVPEPYDAMSSEFEQARYAEDYEGVLVRLEERFEITPCIPINEDGEPNCCVGDYDKYGNLETDVLTITNEFYSIPTGTSCLTSVTGIVTWFFGYRLSPRGPEDIVVPEECRGQ